MRNAGLSAFSQIHKLQALGFLHVSYCPVACLQIRSCLRHTQWDTRVAASTCLGLMAAHFTHHSVVTLADAAGPAIASPVKTEELDGAAAMPFHDFNITQVLQQGTVLVASGGQVCPLYNLATLMFSGVLLLKCVLLDSTADFKVLPSRNMKRYLTKAQGQNSSQNSRRISSSGQWC